MKAKAKYGQATRLASTTDLPREQWLAIRKLGIGSSDAAVAVGLSPYRCPLSLWLEKTGRKEPEDISHKEAVLWGIELKPVLAQVYTKRTGYRVRRVNAVLQHPEHLFMLANLDREVVGHPDGPGILEIKTASYHSAPQWEEGVPVAYQCQVLHQLAVIRSDTLPLLTPTFGTCSDLGKLKHDTNGFTLALPGNPAETWAWDSRTLTLHK